MKKNGNIIKDNLFKWVLGAVLVVVFADVLALTLTVCATILLRCAELVRMIPSF